MCAKIFLNSSIVLAPETLDGLVDISITQASLNTHPQPQETFYPKMVLQSQCGLLLKVWWAISMGKVKQ